MLTVGQNKFSDMQVELEAFDVVKVLSPLASGSADLQKTVKAAQSSVATLAGYVKKREASPAAKALITLTSQLCSFADAIS